MSNRSLLAVAALGVALTACTAPPPSHAGSTAPRIAALAPFVADDALAIGAQACLVAVSAFTDAPAARGLPQVADVTSVDAERIVALHPSAAVGIPSQRRLVSPLQRAGIRVVLLPDDAYSAIFTNLQTIGGLCGKRREASELVAQLKRTTAALHARTKAFAHHPSVFVVLDGAPIWTSGSRSYISTLIGLAGGRNAAGDLHAAYGEYSPEALLRAQPDLLIVDPAAHLDASFGSQPWRGLRAVQQHHVYAVSPADIIERPGPHYNDGIRWLMDRIAPLAT